MPGRPRTQFHRVFRTRGLDLVGGGDGGRIWSIVCIFVDRVARGQGVADAMVASAVDLARHHGAELVEAYSIVQVTKRSAQLSSGTVGLFTRAGFRPTSSVGGRRAVMILDLAGRPRP